MPWVFPWRRAATGALVAGGVVLASYSLPVEAVTARATLYFPPARPVDWRGPSDGNSMREEPRDWTRSVMASAKFGEQVRLALGSSVDAEVAEASSLLADSEHLSCLVREPGLLVLEVRGDRPEMALQLCAGVITFLKTEVELERARRVESALARLVEKQADALERQESAENQIVKQLREFSKKDPTAEPDLAFFGGRREPVDSLSQQSYREGLAASRRLRSRELQLALQEETALPGFAVTDPPHLYTPGRPVWYTPTAAALGLGLGLLIGRAGRRQHA